MPQSEDKLALDALNKYIQETTDNIETLESKLMSEQAKLLRLTHQKKSMENYLNSDNN
jgi:hypothetical protein